jgi:hypothetical protein
VDTGQLRQERTLFRYSGCLPLLHNTYTNVHDSLHWFRDSDFTQNMEVAHPTTELNQLKEEFSSLHHFYIFNSVGYGSRFGRADWETSTSTYMLWLQNIALLILFRGKCS